MRRVLIVSPHFPPVSAPDMHRVRMSLPYFAENGWTPIILTVRHEAQNASLDPELAASVPGDVLVTRTGALPLRVTRAIGVGNVGIRAFGHLYQAGVRLIRDHDVDLVYFSTTMFATLPLGRLWKQRLGVPYVIDMQDPWFSTYYDDKPASERPPKYRLARRLHGALEPWTMRHVSGLISVSDSYVDTLRRRYPWLDRVSCDTIPFGASERDFEVARAERGERQDAANTVSPDLRGVYVGRCGPAMATAIRIVCRALRDGRTHGSVLSRVSLDFVGTDYAPAGLARKSVDPIAASEQVAACVSEETARVGYFEAIRLMQRADFLLVLGSDDPQYIPSKLYPSILARRPIVAVVHEGSACVDVIRRTGAGIAITFRDRDDIARPAADLVTAWPALLDRLPCEPATDWHAVAPFMARELTRRQCGLFDAALQPQGAAVTTPCTG